MAPSFLEERIHHRELLSADSLRQDAIFHTQECKRAPESSLNGPILAHLRPPTPDALTPENSDNSVIQEIEESEVRSTKRRVKTRSCAETGRNRSVQEMGALQKSPRPKMIKLIPTSKVLESAAILSMRRENSEPASSAGGSPVGGMRRKPRKLTSQESMGKMSEQNESYFSIGPSEIADSYYFKPAMLSVADKLKQRRIKANMAIQGQSFTPVNGFLQIQNADFSKMMESLHESCEPSQASSFIEPRNLQPELGYATRPNFRSQKGKLNKSHIAGVMERSFEMSSFRSEAPVRRDPHEYFGRSVEYFGVQKGMKPPPGTLSPSFSPSVSGTPSPLHRTESPDIPLIGLQTPSESPIHRAQFYPRSPQTKTTSSLFSSPHKASPPLGFGERIEVASVIKTDSNEGDNYEELLGALSKTPPSPEETQQLKQLESDSLIREELIRCRTEQAGGPAGGLDSTDSLGEELKTPGASELLARSAQDFPGKQRAIRVVRDYDEDSGSSLYWTPQPRKKSYRQSLFRPPKIKFQDSRGESINQPSSILSSAQPSKPSIIETREDAFADIDVTDCELKPYAIYKREELLNKLVDVLYGKEWEGEQRDEGEERRRQIGYLKELEWKLGVGLYAQDFLRAMLQQKVSRFAEKCPWLHFKYSMKELEEEQEHSSIRMEASHFRAKPDYLCTEARPSLMKEDAALLFMQGIDPHSSEDTFLHRSAYVGQLQDQEGQSTDSVNERTAGVLRAVEQLKQEIARVWTPAQQRTLEHPGLHFKSKLLSFKCAMWCLLLKEGIALFFLILAFQQVSQLWEEVGPEREDVMGAWAVLVVLSLAVGVIFLQPLKIMLQLRLFVKCRLRCMKHFFLNGAQFAQLRSDRELVQLYRDRRRDSKLLPVALEQMRADQEDGKEEGEEELKRRLQRLYGLLCLEK